MAWLPKQTVVVPTDFSEESLNAVGLAKTMVADVGGLHVLHVLEPLSQLSPGIAYGELTDDQRGRNTLQFMRDKLSDDYRTAVMAVIHGSPGLEIAKYAKDVGAELIVMPSHGYTGVKHLMLGSVAERTARHATCPVLILRNGLTD